MWPSSPFLYRQKTSGYADACNDTWSKIQLPEDILKVKDDTKLRPNEVVCHITFVR